MIRGLRHRGARVGTPAFAQDYLRALSERQGVPSRSVDVERDAAVVLELFLDKGARIGREGPDRSDVADLVEISAALLGIADDATDDQIDAVARALAAVVGRLRPSLVQHDLAQDAEDSLEPPREHAAHCGPARRGPRSTAAPPTVNEALLAEAHHATRLSVDGGRKETPLTTGENGPPDAGC